MFENLKKPRKVALEAKFWGTGIQSGGSFTGWKGLAKYVVTYGAFNWPKLVEQHWPGLVEKYGEYGVPDILPFVRPYEYEVANADIVQFLEHPLALNAGYPFAMFFQHVNSITLEEAALEGSGVLALGLSLNGLGRFIRWLGDKAHEQAGDGANFNKNESEILNNRANILTGISFSAFVANFMTVEYIKSHPELAGGTGIFTADAIPPVEMGTALLFAFVAWRMYQLARGKSKSD
jgi:hypothetical protein